MAYTDIDKSDEHFNTATYSGDSATTQAITGVGFQPDWVWIKGRNSAVNHNLWDAIRGTSKYLITNSAGSENTDATLFDSFNSDGFTVGNGGIVNDSGTNYVGWCWKGANGTASNTNGSITSTVSANTTSGFSVVSYTGTGSTATVGHGLGVTPAMIIVKDRTNGSTSWVIWNKNFSSLTNNYLTLQTTNGVGTFSNYWGTSAPTSSVFGVGSGGLDNNKSSANIIAYCFAEKKGFSKFGSYIGNGSADGQFTYTGFKPAFIVLKQTSSSGNNWQMMDNKRNTFNVLDKVIYPNLSNAEDTTGATSNTIDFVSNGFKSRGSNGQSNGSGSTYIYMAFAENPFVTSTGIPACAR